MRLLFLSPVASLGGAERVLVNLLGGIRRTHPAWPLGLIVAADGPLADEARRLGVKTVVCAFPESFARAGDSGLGGGRSWMKIGWHGVVSSVAMASYVRELRHEMAAFKPDVVHSNGFKMHLLGALARPSGAALVWHFHDYLSSRHVTSRLIGRLKGRCDAIVAVSDDIASDVRRALGASPVVTTVWNGVDLARFKPEGPRLDLDALSGLSPSPSAVLRVGLVATFARWKGQLLFLDMLKALLPRHAIRGYIIGAPMYQSTGSQFSVEELRRAIAAAGLSSSVGLTGFVEDPSAAFRALDVVVHASTAPEPFGLVIAEAMAVGRPLVTSGAGGAAELVTPEVNALTYASKDASSLATAVERLLGDAALRRRLGQAARDAALERFGTTRFVEQLLAVYARFDRRAAA